MKRKRKREMKRNMKRMENNRMGIWGLLFLSLFMLLLIVPAVEAEDHVVKIKEFNFHPADLTVKVGDTVTWVNEMPYGHWVISGADIRHDNSFFSPLLLKNHTFKYTFKDPLVQDYYCPIHSMQGRVTVLGAKGEEKVEEGAAEKKPEKKKRRRRRR